MQEFSNYPRIKRTIIYLSNTGMAEAIETLEVYKILIKTQGEFAAAKFLMEVYQEIEKSTPEVNQLNVR